jgi:hypothetical protein
LERLFARQTKLLRARQGIFYLADGATDRGFTDTIGLSYMKFSSILSPVHQGHQQLIGSAQFRRPPKVTQPFLNNFQHLLKGFSLDTRETLEICAF